MQYGENFAFMKTLNGLYNFVIYSHQEVNGLVVLQARAITRTKIDNGLYIAITIEKVCNDVDE